jgi:glycosyltransferase involved in cell wall biosynthesis
VVTSSLDGFQVEQQELSRNSTIYRLPIGKKGRNIHFQNNTELLRYSFECYRFLRKLLARESFDVCHAVMTVPGGINAWLIRRKVPYLVSLQGSDVPGYSARFKLLYTVLTPIIHRIWKDSRGVVSNSEVLRELAWQSAPEQCIDVIPNGVDRHRFFPDDGLPATPEKLRIICVGRLIERKGVWELLEALPKVLARVPQAHLDLAGSGNLKQALADRITSMDLNNAVTLHGAVPQEELPVLLRQASLFALPSHAEGMSNALLEGIACGLPVVVTDTGGTKELVDGNGLVIPMKDPDALADAIIEILSDEAKRAAMRKASLKVADRYSWETLGQAYYKLYDDIIRSEDHPKVVQRPA